MRKDRIEARLLALGINQFEAAEKAGKNSHFIYDFMVGRKKSFKGDGPIRVAQALECSLEYLSGESDLPGKPPMVLPEFAPAASGGLPVAGVVEAGIFRNVGSFHPPDVTLPLLPLPMFPAGDQMAFIVRGGGMDGRGIVEGMVLHAVRAEAAPVALRSGAVVIVEHSRQSGREVEISARELQYFPDRTEFRAKPKSESVAPIVERDGKTGERGGKVRVIAVVIAATLLL